MKSKKRPTNLQEESQARNLTQTSKATSVEITIFIKLKIINESKCESDAFWPDKRVRLLWRLWGGNMSDYSDRWCLVIEYFYILTYEAWKKNILGGEWRNNFSKLRN